MGHTNTQCAEATQLDFFVCPRGRVTPNERQICGSLYLSHQLRFEQAITPPRSSCSSKLRAIKPTPPRSPLQPLDASMEPSALRKRRGSAPVVLPTITGGKKR